MSHVVVAELAVLEPHLRPPPPPQQVIHAPGDGAVDPVAVTQSLLQAARDHGAEDLQTTVTAVCHEGGRVVGLESSSGFLPGEQVILVAGTGVRAVCSPLGVDLPVEASPALLVRCSAPRGLVRTLVATPDVEVRHSAEGDLLTAVSYGGLDAPETRYRAGQRALAHIRAAFRGADTATVTSTSVGVRPIPVDGVSIAGRLVADEIVEDLDAAELQRCRPARFVAAPRRSPDPGRS